MCRHSSLIGTAKRIAAVAGVGVLVAASGSVTAPPAAAATPPSATAAALEPMQSSCLAQAIYGSCRIGSDQTFTVPAGMSSVMVTAVGGGGASSDGVSGGAGGFVIAQLSVAAGQTLKVQLGRNADGKTPGTGWRSGGALGTDPVSDTPNGGGAGGGATAVTSDGGVVLVVAGGGGGAGASYNSQWHGGRGGNAGRVASAGFNGSGANDGSSSAHGGDPDDPSGPDFPAQGGAVFGSGGCANGINCSGSGEPVPQDGRGGHGIVDNVALLHNGGGGGGGKIGGWGGESSGVVLTDPLMTPLSGGGGGGGGTNFTDTSARELTSASRTSTTGGYVQFSAAGSLTRFTCGQSNTDFAVPFGVDKITAVAVGGRGSVPDDSGQTGWGAAAVGTIGVKAGQALSAVVGCRGHNHTPASGYGTSGAGGGAPGNSAYQGGSGGAASAVEIGGDPILIAGGGGGAGGGGFDVQSNTPNSAGGDGGSAGYSWDSAAYSGAGDGGGDSGGTGGARGQGSDGTNGEGGSGFPSESGGGGGGGSGFNGGYGGGTAASEGGSGGGAGSSQYDPRYVTDPSIATANGGDDGYIVLIAIPRATDYNNNGTISVAPAGTGSGRGFDNNGQWYSTTALAKWGLIAGQPTPSVDGVSAIWPDVANGQNDNYIANGQTIPLTGHGEKLQILAASTYGQAGGAATINFNDGTTQTFNLTMANWTDTKPAPGTIQAFTFTDGTVKTADVNLNLHTSIWGLTVVLPHKRAMSLTLPHADEFSSNGPTLHVFTAALGEGSTTGLPTNNVGISTAAASSGNSGGFDNLGNYFDADRLNANGFTPGAAPVRLATTLHLQPNTPSTPLNLFWPTVTAGNPDNMLTDGQVINFDGWKYDTMIVIGAASFGPASGLVRITYSDNSTQQFPFTFADWITSTPAPNTTLVYSDPNTNVSNGGTTTGQASLFGATFTINRPAGTHIQTVTLTGDDGYDTDTPAMHIFAIGTGMSIGGHIAGPAPANLTAADPTSSGVDTVVAPGDTLSDIAAAHHVIGGTQTLLDNNRSTVPDADTITAGQRIKVAGVAPVGTVDVLRISARSGPSKGLVDHIEASHLNGLTLQVVRNIDGTVAIRSWSESEQGMKIINESGVDITVSATRGTTTRINTELSNSRTITVTVPR